MVFANGVFMTPLIPVNRLFVKRVAEIFLKFQMAPLMCSHQKRPDSFSRRAKFSLDNTQTIPRQYPIFRTTQPCFSPIFHDTGGIS